MPDAPKMIISPPENDSFRKDLCFSPDVYFFSERKISEMRGPTGLKFCTMVSTRSNFIMPVQNFGGYTLKKFRGRKTWKFGPISDNFEVQRRISPKRMKIFKIGFFNPSTEIPPALGETNPVKFGPVTLEISMWNRSHLKCIFRKNIFRPLGGAVPPNFYTR